MLSKITLTGVDMTVDVISLAEQVASIDPTVTIEFALLYRGDDAARTVGGRFNTANSLKKFVEVASYFPVNVHSAIHLCGVAVNEFINGRGPGYDLSWDFSRVQLNFQANRIDVEALKARVEAEIDHKIIIQHNVDNQSLCERLADRHNVSFLFDQSCGKGVLQNDYPNAVSDRCGYAGGLGPLNLHTEVPKIIAASRGRAKWVDMETGVRSESDAFCTKRAVDAVVAFCHARGGRTAVV
jgi:phosphoribosylanthranilate isomerase